MRAVLQLKRRGRCPEGVVLGGRHGDAIAGSDCNLDRGARCDGTGDHRRRVASQIATGNCEYLADGQDLRIGCGVASRAGDRSHDGPFATGHAVRSGVPSLVTLNKGGRAQNQRRVGVRGVGVLTGQCEINELPGSHVSGSKDCRGLVAGCCDGSAINRQCRRRRCDRQELSERADVASAIGDGRNNGADTVGQQTVENQAPCATGVRERLVGLGNTINGDPYLGGGHGTRDTRDRGVGNKRAVGRGDRHARRTREQVVVGHCDRTSFGEQATVDDGAFAGADCAVRHQRSDEHVAGTDATGTVDLPEDVLGLCSVDQVHFGVRAEGHRGFDLEDEYGVAVALAIDGELRRRGRADSSDARVYARSERQPADVAGHRGARRTAFGVRVGSLKVSKCVCKSGCDELVALVLTSGSERVGGGASVTTERGAAGAGERRIRSHCTE